MGDEGKRAGADYAGAACRLVRPARPGARPSLRHMIAAGALALLSACGQKGPLYMPANAGPAASTRHGGDNMPLTPVPPVQSASSPGVLSGVVPAR